MPCNCTDLITTAARKVASAVHTIASDDTDDATFNKRQAICADCPDRYTKIRMHYCKPCGCPGLYHARLIYKNRKKGHECPLKKFGRVE